MDDRKNKTDLVPMVSISCITYNHAPYIRECLDGFMMQKTNFAFEVLIHDDASTDGTADIIREYEAKYPDIIKPIYQTENQYSKGISPSASFNFPRAKGKYIALCEGDDYWTDPFKLQKQVDFLESHPDYVMCSHRFKQYIQDEHRFIKDWYTDETEDVVYDLANLINGGWYHHPLSVLFRVSALDLGEYNRYPKHMDAVLFFHLLKKGKGVMFNEDWAVYRIHKGGVWTMVGLNNQRKQEFQARLGICKVEQSPEAAKFLLYQFKKFISRKWMIKEWRMMLRTFNAILSQLGFKLAFKVFFDKLVLSKVYDA